MTHKGSMMHSAESSSIRNCATPWRPGQGTGHDGSAGPALSPITGISMWPLADPVGIAGVTTARCGWQRFRRTGPPFLSPRPDIRPRAQAPLLLGSATRRAFVGVGEVVGSCPIVIRLRAGTQPGRDEVGTDTTTGKVPSHESARHAMTCPSGTTPRRWLRRPMSPANFGRSSTNSGGRRDGARGSPTGARDRSQWMSFTALLKEPQPASHGRRCNAGVCAVCGSHTTTELSLEDGHGAIA